jgi:hypothetical protein
LRNSFSEKLPSGSASEHSISYGVREDFDWLVLILLPRRAFFLSDTVDETLVFAAAEEAVLFLLTRFAAFSTCFATLSSWKISWSGCKSDLEISSALYNLGLYESEHVLWWLFWEYYCSMKLQNK